MRRSGAFLGPRVRGPRRGSPAGVLDPPAMSAKREKYLKILTNFARLRRVAGGTPAVPQRPLREIIETGCLR